MGVITRYGDSPSQRQKGLVKNLGQVPLSKKKEKKEFFGYSKGQLLNKMMVIEMRDGCCAVWFMFMVYCTLDI